MAIELREKSYLVILKHGKKKEHISLSGTLSDDEIVRFIRRTFAGRFKRPEALKMRDGVRVIVKCIDHIKRQETQVFNSHIFNKSVLQAKIMIEQSIKGNASC